MVVPDMWVFADVARFYIRAPRVIVLADLEPNVLLITYRSLPRRGYVPQLRRFQGCLLDAMQQGHWMSTLVGYISAAQT